MQKESGIFGASLPCSGGGVNALRPWMSGANDSGLPAIDASYAGEDNMTQAGINICDFGVSVSAATESFDEMPILNSKAGRMNTYIAVHPSCF